MSDPRRPGPPPQRPYPSFEERAYGAPDRLQNQPTLQAPPRGGGPDYYQPRRKPRRWGRALFVVFLGLLAVISAGAIFLITNPPTDLIRAQLIDQVKARTGRTLEIAGPTKFTIIPALGVSMKDVTLSQPPGLEGPPFAKMAGLDVSVRLLPLLNRDVAIDQLVLHQPVIDLRVNKSGRASWDFATRPISQPRSVRVAQAGGATSDAPGGLPEDARQFLENAGDARKSGTSQKQAALAQLQFGDVRIVNGMVRYSDARSGAKQFVDAVNVRLRLDDIAAPLQSKGNLRWKKERLDFSSTLTSVADILADKPAALLFNVNSNPLNSRYDGTIQLGARVHAKGALVASSPSVRQLARWLDTDLPPAPGFGAMQISGILDSRGDTHKISSAKVELDNQLAQGVVVVKTGGARPAINADLKISELNLNNYMSDGTAPPPKRQTQNSKKPAADAKPQSIEDLLSDPGTRVRGYSARAGWSRDPIGTAFLSAADVQAKLLIGRLLVKNLKIGQSDLNVLLKNKVLQTKINEIALYSGRGSGTIVGRDAGSGALDIKSSLSLQGVEALDLLRDAAGQDWLSGKGNMKVDVSGRGVSQYQIVQSLNGSTNLSFQDGAIVGINIPQLIRNISQGNLAGLSNTSPTAKTDFSSLVATWAIKNGVATNRDLKLLSPLMRVGGEGSLNLPAQSIDYMLRPKLVASLEGQGADAAGSGLEIPVRIKGPWAKPQIQPEVGDILANPDKAIDAIKKIGKQFKGKDANEIIDGLLGGGNATENGDNKPNSAGDLLDRFLR